MIAIEWLRQCVCVWANGKEKQKRSVHFAGWGEEIPVTVCRLTTHENLVGLLLLPEQELVVAGQ